MFLLSSPVVALKQWKSEIETHAEGLTVLIWHGASRKNEANEFRKFDVILTSYGTLQSAYTKQAKGFKRRGQILREKRWVSRVQS